MEPLSKVPTGQGQRREVSVSGPRALSQWASPFPAPTKGSPGPSLASRWGSCSLTCLPQVRETVATSRGPKVRWWTNKRTLPGQRNGHAGDSVAGGL